MAEGQSTRATVAIIGAGEMGSAVGRHLREAGARVITEVKGRSRPSVERVRRAGLEVIDDDDRLVSEADYFLSIVPPGVALSIAERFREPLMRANPKPVFVECNAISPATTRKIHSLLAPTGCGFVDGGIIGGPPPADSAGERRGPRFYVSGPEAESFARLAAYGLDIVVLEGPVGAASGLKLAYAGLTKGLTALGAAMIGAAAREGLGEALRSELARTQPDILSRFERFIPSMFPKAYRWVAEMEEIAAFAGSAGEGATIYEGAARLYERIAAEMARGESSGRLATISEFCNKPG
ncbi:MAG TPA: DUF1932 domain-containing protein [Candidatus Binataceae bacterium]|nr:DUF1932 domain-containing protein [Candidatus Binataceae bacterium]